MSLEQNQKRSLISQSK